MQTNEYDLLCIGSGPAGQRAAIQAAKLGKRVAVVEKRRAVGGVCIETGTIPSKTFREAVRRVYSRPGLEVTDAEHYRGRVRPTMRQLVGHVSNVVFREIAMVHDVFARNDVAVVHGRAVFEDPHTIVVQSHDADRRRLVAQNILIAVGTEPGQPHGMTADGTTVMTSDTVLDLADLPRTMAVVGAGVVGIEYASIFASLGVQVTVIDQRPRPLEFLDDEIVDELIHQMRKSDVVFRCGDAVEHIDVMGDAHRQGVLTLASGKHLVADVVLCSAGRIGATSDLNLEAAGLSADERGRLLVNERYQTCVPHIAAAGDVVGFPALAATSSEQGRLAACHLFGVPAKPMGSHFPVGIYSIPEISMVGATEQELTRQHVPYETGVARYKEISRGPIVGDDSGMFKMLFHRDDGRLLGCHCIGTGATELIHVGQAVLALGGGLDYFLSTVFNYPTLAECYKVAAFNAANKLALMRRATSTLV
ncbi:MAG TPA: Si-specific NAD(P)(+) transhydrogenase [Pseudomonadales bacterium]|nr:Si-specific NAD(P)(+) transhydrogenase [Pseudomonadales bacterium]